MHSQIATLSCVRSIAHTHCARSSGCDKDMERLVRRSLERVRFESGSIGDASVRSAKPPAHTAALGPVRAMAGRSAAFRYCRDFTAILDKMSVDPFWNKSLEDSSDDASSDDSADDSFFEAA